MLGWIVHIVTALSWWGVAILMAIENVVLPLPSELIMPLAGFAAGRGMMSLWTAIIAGTIGSVVGALPLYWLARAIGRERLEHWVARHGRWLMLTPRHLRTAEEHFRGNDFRAVAIGQLLPAVRGLISLPAGIARMNLAEFLVANLIGTAVWCAALALGGDALGANYDRIAKWLGPVGWTLLGVLVLGATVWIVRRRRRARARD